MAALEKVPGDGTYKQYTGENGVLYKDLAAAVYEMLYKGFMYYYGQPGWVHRSYMLGKRTFGSELSMFDNQTLEIWEKVEADRSISQYYELVKADDGTVISELARMDGKTTFLAGNPIETGLERWGQAHMPDLPDRIAAPLDGESCSGSMESFGASPTFNVSCRRDYRSALQKPSIPFEFWHYSRDWTIAPNTGVITRINDSYSDAAWKQSWQEEIELLTIERADEPPVEILEKLK